MHHGFSGGLLEHTLSVLHLCEYFAGAYPILNRDLLFAAAMCHDIGKTRELSAFPDNDYTDEGQLIGHIVIGVEMIGEAVRSIGFPGAARERTEALRDRASRRTGIRFAEKTGARGSAGAEPGG